MLSCGIEPLPLRPTRRPRPTLAAEPAARAVAVRAAEASARSAARVAAERAGRNAERAAQSAAAVASRSASQRPGGAEHVAEAGVLAALQALNAVRARLEDCAWAHLDADGDESPCEVARPRARLGLLEQALPVLVEPATRPGATLPGLAPARLHCQPRVSHRGRMVPDLRQKKPGRIGPPDPAGVRGKKGLVSCWIRVSRARVAP